MRLWHEALLSDLPRAQLLGQHRECCALRGNSWGKPHATVDYVFDYSPIQLYRYHRKVMDEMQRRGYQVDPLWDDPCYRGKNCAPYREREIEKRTTNVSDPVYPEHDETYLYECIENLRAKGAEIRPK
ncbi:MAG TPA: TIGR02328 family protein [Bacillales bacterium]|nr:TIGR02328 family protein [Bacillales bacterium]